MTTLPRHLALGCGLLLLSGAISWAGNPPAPAPIAAAAPAPVAVPPAPSAHVAASAPASSPPAAVSQTPVATPHPPTPPPPENPPRQVGYHTPYQGIGIPGAGAGDDQMRKDREDARNAEAQLQAEALRMAEAALASQGTTTAPSDSVYAEPVATSTVPAGTGSLSAGAHHSLTGLAVSAHQLGPDPSDKSHHSIDELFY